MSVSVYWYVIVCLYCGLCVVACFRVQGVCQVWTFPPEKTNIGQEVNGSTLSIQHYPPVDLVLVAKLSLLHPYDTGNYIVRESENVPMKLIEDSDECNDRTDDHRNVWIIRERHAGSVCSTRRESH